MKRREVFRTSDGLIHAIREPKCSIVMTMCGTYTWWLSTRLNCWARMNHVVDDYNIIKSAKPITCLECLAGDASTKGIFDDVDE